MRAEQRNARRDTIQERISGKLHWKLFAVATLSTSLIGCRPDELVSHDLVDLLPDAAITPETSFIDFGTESARSRLRAGFSANETSRDGTSFTWSEGAHSELRLLVSEPRALSLTFRCWPFVFPGAPPQTLTFILNEEPFAEVELATNAFEYRVTLPRARILAGENILRVNYGYYRAVSEVIPGAIDDRLLAVAWDWLRVEGAYSARAPAAEGAGDEASLLLPAGTRVEYFLSAPNRGRLEISAIESEALSILTVVVDTVAKRSEQRIEAPVRRVVVELPPAGQLTRIALQAGSRDLTLSRPAVFSTPTLERRAPAASATPKEAPKPNVIVYLIDTLRADHLSCYGYPKPTPHIDRLASKGVLFERALAQSSWTRPATASILTGFHPRAHTANRRDDALPPSVPTLAEELAAMGYETAGLVVNANVAAPFGFDRGFETFELLLHQDGILGASGDRLVDRAVQWLDRRSKHTSERPFFLYLHTTDPHDPYGTTGFHGQGFGTVSFLNSLDEGKVALSASERERLIALYDEDVAFADAQLGNFVSALEERGLYDDALFVLLSDHGEEFEDHGRWRHGKTLYEEQLQVPLIVKLPRGAGAGRRVSAFAQHIDIVPTILDAAGKTPSVARPGRSLLPMVPRSALESKLEERAVLSYLLLDGRELESIVVKDWKLIRTLTYDREVAPYQLFDLSLDRRESTSVAETKKHAADFLEAYLRHLTPTAMAGATRVEIDIEMERQLRALGYVP